MKNTEKQQIKTNFRSSPTYLFIKNCIKKYKSVDERVKAVEAGGCTVKENVPMGSGGVGQVKVMPKLNEIRIQISHGVSRHNYAYAVIIDLDKQNFRESATQQLIKTFSRQLP